MVWKELALDGNTAHSFEEQITALEPFLGENWKARVSPKSGNPVYERPVVPAIYRNDHRFLLDQVIPKPGGTVADYDLVIASQPYRARFARVQGQTRAGAARPRDFGQANYMAAKLGIMGLSRGIALDMERFNVRSNCIAPFAFTRMIESIPAQTEEEKRHIDAFRAMTPDKIAAQLKGAFASSFTPPERSEDYFSWDPI